jgi:hypothetical protein
MLTLKIEDWFVSGVFTGFRVAEGYGGNKIFYKGFPVDSSDEGSIEKARIDAEQWIENHLRGIK